MGALGNRGAETTPWEEEHMAQIAELLGGIPDAMLRRGKLTGELFEHLEPSCWILKHIQLPLDSLQQRGLQARLKSHITEDTEVVAADKLFRYMLAAEPADRSTATTLLQVIESVAAAAP